MATALFVDDSDFMRELLKTLVANHNIEAVGDANNGRSAVAKYKELKPDIVFMDVMMNEMNGIEALKKIKEIDPDAKVVIVSSMMEQGPFVDDVTTHGAAGVINKPLNGKQVAEVIKSLGF